MPAEKHLLHPHDSAQHHFNDQVVTPGAPLRGLGHRWVHSLENVLDQPTGGGQRASSGGKGSRHEGRLSGQRSHRRLAASLCSALSGECVTTCGISGMGLGF